jgi:hypothetical protein
LALAVTLLVRRVSGKFQPFACTAAAGFLLGCAVLERKSTSAAQMSVTVSHRSGQGR